MDSYWVNTSENSILRNALEVQGRSFEKEYEALVTEGEVGETYNIGGHNERKNIDVVKTVCTLLEELVPSKPDGVEHYADLITYVTDRPGHDMRYAIDAAKIERELGWRPQETFESGIRKTVEWYLANESWWKRVQDGSYAGERLGLQ